MKPARMTPLLNVLDIRASVSFYEALGFAVRERWGDAEDRAWCLLVCGELHMMLNQTTRAASDHRRGRPDYSDLVIYLYVEDAPACWRELQTAGLSGRHIGPQEYGLDEVWLRDPDGYHVVVASDV